jgi:hypothetical protein
MKTIYLLLSAVIIIWVTACTTPSVNQEEDTSLTANASFATSGEDVDVLKRYLESYVAGDWEALRSCFTDSVYFAHNIWLDAKVPKISADAIVDIHKRAREENWENISIAPDPIYEVVTTDTGEKFGHIWCNLSVTSKITGKQIVVPIFGSYWFQGDKLSTDWAFYNTKDLE